LNATHTNCVFPVNNFNSVKENILNWISRFGIFVFLDNHRYQLTPHTQEVLAAAGCKESVNGNAGNMLAVLQYQLNKNKSWWFGHLGYDLKNEIESLSSGHPDRVGFPDLFFFRPQVIIRMGDGYIEIDGKNPQKIFSEIVSGKNNGNDSIAHQVDIRPRISKEEYISAVNRLRRHILRGDCYEINFCQEFFSEEAVIDPLAVYKSLSAVSPNPFSAFYRVKDAYLLCASPERFLKKSGNQIISQPIKGTSVRFPSNTEKDLISKINLSESEKDKSENVMVVDLVRNDLSKICKEGSVKVTELFGVYSFPQVHQMISTISGELEKDIDFKKIIFATFPMGSMTGAPKKRVMELIETYEKTKRGIFSGAVGYISPEGDFDFNVVIRSIMYNAASRYLSFQAGSGITFNSDPEKEYEECLLKAGVLNKIFEKK